MWRTRAHFGELIHGENAQQQGRNLGLEAFDAAFTIGAEAANIINVAVQLKTAMYQNLAKRGMCMWYLAADANGDSLHAAPPSGIAVGTAGLLIETLDNQAGMVLSEADGTIDVDINHGVGVDTYYLALVPVRTGELLISGAITFA